MNIQVGDLWCLSRPNRKPAYFIVKDIQKYLTTVDDLRIFVHWLDENDSKLYYGIHSLSVIEENGTAYKRLS